MPLSFVRSTLAILWSCFFWQVNIFLPNQVSRILPELRSSSIRKVLPRMRSRNTSWKARLMARHSRISSSLYCSRRQISWHLAHSHFFARRAQSRIPMWPKKNMLAPLHFIWAWVSFSYLPFSLPWTFLVPIMREANTKFPHRQQRLRTTQGQTLSHHPRYLKLHRIHKSLAPARKRWFRKCPMCISPSFLYTHCCWHFFTASVPCSMANTSSLLCAYTQERLRYYSSSVWFRIFTEYSP